jgi:hypothetical protein
LDRQIEGIVTEEEVIHTERLNMRLSISALLFLGIVGCSEYLEMYGVESRETKLLKTRQSEAVQKQSEVLQKQAEIMELYKSCLQRKETDPKVDCSEYRTALDIVVKDGR